MLWSGSYDAVCQSHRSDKHETSKRTGLPQNVADPRIDPDASYCGRQMLSALHLPS